MKIHLEKRQDALWLGQASHFESQAKKKRLIASVQPTCFTGRYDLLL